MSSTLINIHAVGHTPVTRGDMEKHRVWRSWLEAQVQPQVEGVKVPKSPALGFGLTITFWLTERNYAERDLDNLAKGVIDTVFAALGLNDKTVTRILLEKRIVPGPESEGVDVQVVWSP